MKKYLSLLFLVFIITGCSSNNNDDKLYKDYINVESPTIKTRIKPPSGFEYVTYPNDSFEEYVTNLTLLPDKSPVMIYDGRKKGNQNMHVAIIDLDVGKKDLQQCADAIMRIRAEYLFDTNQYDKIMFHLANGFLFKYTDYRNGYRLDVDYQNNSVKLVKTSSYNKTYEAFRSYLDDVFNFANTVSLKDENLLTNINEIKPGDFFVDNKHADIVVGVAYNKDTKQTVYLLAQSYIPAQSIHILKNTDDSPWYYVDDKQEKIVTPAWTFKASDVYKFK